MDKIDKFHKLQLALTARHAQQRYRQNRLAASPQQPHRQIDGKCLLNFCSNDYLGLANHPRVVQAFQQAAATYGVGSGAAHLLGGHTHLHHALEEALAAFTGRERALLFSTGYMANLGVVQALLSSRHDLAFADRLNHASLVDAVRLSGAKHLRYPHNDSAALAHRLAATASSQGIRLILTDGVFSMDGDIAPLAALATLAKQYDAWLLVDDAHGIGVLGQSGAGALEAAGLGQEDIPILIGTFGKAFGTAGAFVAGSHLLIEYLIQSARPWVYTTAPPPALAAATLASLQLVQEEGWRREHLQQLIRQFRSGAAQLGLPLLPSSTPIQPLVVGETARALAWSRQLEAQGILVPAIRPPTVPEGTARLRVSLSAAHTAEDVDRLLAALAACQTG